MRCTSETKVAALALPPRSVFDPMSKMPEAVPVITAVIQCQGELEDDHALHFAWISPKLILTVEGSPGATKHVWRRRGPLNPHACRRCGKTAATAHKWCGDNPINQIPHDW